MPRMFATVSPQETIPPSLSITPAADIAIHNESSNMVRVDMSFGLDLTFGICKSLCADQTRLSTDWTD